MLYFMVLPYVSCSVRGHSKQLPLSYAYKIFTHSGQKHINLKEVVSLNCLMQITVIAVFRYSTILL